MPSLLAMLLLPLLLFTQQGARVDLVYLKTGKVVRGKITSEKLDFTIVETDVGQLLVAADKIDRVMRNVPDPRRLRRVKPKDGAKRPAKRPAGAPTQAKTGPPTKRPKAVAETPAKSVGKPAGKRADERAAQPVQAPAGPPPVILVKGRILDRYKWLEGIGLTGRFLCLLILFGGACGVLQLAVQLLALRPLPWPRTLAVAVIWELLLVGALLVPNPTVPVAACAGVFVVAAWIVTSVAMLRASMSQTLLLGMLGTFSATLVVLGAEMLR